MSASTLNAGSPKVIKMNEKETCDCWISERRRVDGLMLCYFCNLPGE